MGTAGGRGNAARKRVPTNGRQVLRPGNGHSDTLHTSKKKRKAKAGSNRFGKEGSADRSNPADWAFYFFAPKMRAGNFVRCEHGACSFLFKRIPRLVQVPRQHVAATG
ncbi:hypothetical protein ACTJIL_04205 [Luteimonas sp. 22616]|uniref:hypothetical protein n=1 Tax=Luteimonas sp. 22616 TaxID=3453951 RepID=UPI003F82C68C